MAILYVETNFLAASATGRDTLTTILLHSGIPGLDLVVPGICFQEALRWIGDERKRRESFGRSLKDQVTQLKRDISGATHSLVSLLEQAVVENDEHMSFTSDRLFWAVEKLSNRAEILPVTAALLETSRDQVLIDGLTDNLIAHTILAHARSSPVTDKALLTENSKDFSRPEVRDALFAAGVKYFSKTEPATEWADSCRSGPTE
jgi:hypothetical protein